jgi:hypothetical protein
MKTSDRVRIAHWVFLSVLAIVDLVGYGVNLHSSRKFSVLGILLHALWLGALWTIARQFSRITICLLIAYPATVLAYAFAFGPQKGFHWSDWMIVLAYGSSFLYAVTLMIGDCINRSRVREALDDYYVPWR